MEEARWLSAKYREDFAYPTVKDRIPVILTKIVDQLYRMKADAKEKYGDDAVEDLKHIVGAFSKLKNEIQTDKPVIPITDSWRDAEVWNSYLLKEKGQTEADVVPSWFVSPWLYVECYFYRRILEAFQLSSALKEFDPFASQKQAAFFDSEQALSGLGTFLLDATSPDYSAHTPEQVFNILFQVALWGNKCDLSISAGAENHQTADPLSTVNQLRDYILINHSDMVWKNLIELEKEKAGASRLDLILDNSGFELFTDLCLAEYLVSTKIVSHVQIYPKAFPWFVSDVTMSDLQWTLDKLEPSSIESLRTLGKKIKGRISSGAFTVKVHDFWTYPHDYSQMKAVAPDLYAELNKSDLILFKGDLNYRKLVRDRKWDPTTSFKTALGGFHPAPLCSLRTLKADVVVGLEVGKAEETRKKSEMWMISGEYGVLQYHGKSLQ